MNRLPVSPESSQWMVWLTLSQSQQASCARSFSSAAGGAAGSVKAMQKLASPWLG